jgi:hypothetical protein
MSADSLRPGAGVGRLLPSLPNQNRGERESEGEEERKTEGEERRGLM